MRALLVALMKFIHLYIVYMYQRRKMLKGYLVLTTFDLHCALLRVVRVALEVHCTRQNQRQSKNRKFTFNNFFYKKYIDINNKNIANSMYIRLDLSYLIRKHNVDTDNLFSSLLWGKEKIPCLLTISTSK